MESNVIAGINKLTALNNTKPSQTVSSPAEVSKQFGNFLNDAINNLNDQQNTVDQMNRKFVAGELPDVHQLMIATEKASLGLELTVQVRNKVIDAYQEIMRMQV